MNARTSQADTRVPGHPGTRMTIPRNLEELRAVSDGVARVRAAQAYLALGEEKLSEARKLRDDAVRALVEEHGPAEAARLTGLSVSSVKAIRGRP